MRADQEIGQSLIFLVSLPRSGSTLLQHILAGHSKVAATAEPWILFPAAYALRPGALTADYDANTGRIALSEFLAQLPGGDEEYYAAVRRMALYLYDTYLAEHGKEWFLDKTSRYYLILPELFRIFPKAKYVYLTRNPLAVLASYLEYMVFGNWKRLGEPAIRYDLQHGYRLVRQGIRHFGDHALVVKYEDLVEDPETIVGRLCERLGLEFEPGMLNYGKRVGVLPGKLVDPKSIQKHETAVKDYVHAWRSKYTTRQERHFARGLLADLGPELVNYLGYSYEDLVSVVSGQEKGWAPLVRWEVLMTPSAQRSRPQEWALDVAFHWQKEGARSAAKYIGKRILGSASRTVRTALRIISRSAREGPGVVSIRRGVQGVSERPGSRQRSTEAQPASADYAVLRDPSEMSAAALQGWRSPVVAERQLAAYVPLLHAMYKGGPRRDFVVAAEALRLTGLPAATLLEIGCGNGYYFEVLSYLTRCAIEYVGADYSLAMIQSARERYPQLSFTLADATHLPCPDNSFEIAWSGTVDDLLRELQT